MAALLGEQFEVNSYHHQAIRGLPPALEAWAWAGDGVIEAVEHVSAPVWGVQWHPERMTGDNPALPDHGALFERFIRQCRG
jgi:putative glutamine amidotransferase